VLCIPSTWIRTRDGARTTERTAPQDAFGNYGVVVVVVAVAVAVWWHHVLAWKKKGGVVWDRARRWATMARGIRDVW